MEHLPKRTNLATETATTLKEWISAGILKDVLPGELQLKKRLGVGRDTLRLALDALTREGWIAPAVKGQQRQLLKREAISEEENRNELLPVTFLSPNSIEARVTLLEMEDTQLRLTEQGRKLQFIAPQIFHLKHPERNLERLVHANPSAAWILFLATEPMQRWFDQQGIRTLIYGSPFPGVELPFVVSDWGAAAFHAGIQLVRKGHRVIAIMEYEERFPGLIAEEDGLRKALATVNAEHQLVVLKDDRTPISVARSLEIAFGLKNRPTALVFTNTSQLLTCYSWLVARGIRVPADVSLVSLVNDSWFADLHPPLCYYQPESRLMSRHIAQRVMELVENGQVTKRSLRIQLEYVHGATIGPVPKSEKQD
ncbi:MAG TPA: substrate-binding domain-containing protein [Verrucomicrobiae bacterium]|nr:substrate-binding domain-containing protein [Verrucomicrobiae bacterium]